MSESNYYHQMLLDLLRQLALERQGQQSYSRHFKSLPYRQRKSYYFRPPSPEPEFQEYDEYCSIIKTSNIHDILRRAQRRSGGLLDIDRRCLQHVITLIEKITERAGAAVWKDARLTMQGKLIEVTLKSGSQTNKFEVRLDGNDVPYDKQIESGLRLKFWNGLHSVKEKASSVFSFVGRLLSVIRPAIGWY